MITGFIGTLSDVFLYLLFGTVFLIAATGLLMICGVCISIILDLISGWWRE